MPSTRSRFGALQNTKVIIQRRRATAERLNEFLPIDDMKFNYAICDMYQVDVVILLIRVVIVSILLRVCQRDLHAGFAA